MALRVEILEPGLALEQGRGYCGLTDPGPGAELVFPHVDSCLAMALILDNGCLVGGHVAAQWPGMKDTNRRFCIERIIALMDALKAQAHGNLAFLVLAGHGSWWHADAGAEVGTAFAHWGDAPTYLGVTTDDKSPQGCNIYVQRDQLVVEKFDSHTRRTWDQLSQMPESIYKTSAF